MLWSYPERVRNTYSHQQAKHDQPGNEEEDVDGESPEGVREGRQEEDRVQDGQRGDDGGVDETRVRVAAAEIDEVEETTEDAEDDGAAAELAEAEEDVEDARGRSTSLLGAGGVTMGYPGVVGRGGVFLSAEHLGCLAEMVWW